MSGVSIFGIKNDVGFYLNALDRESQFAALQRAESALSTFTLTTGVQYLQGNGVSQDATRAAALYKQRCDGGVMAACVDLGVLYDRGTGVPKDLKQAAALYEMACQKGESHGCFNRAGLFREEGNFEKAEELFRKSCDGGNKGVAKG